MRKEKKLLRGEVKNNFHLMGVDFSRVSVFIVRKCGGEIYILKRILFVWTIFSSDCGMKRIITGNLHGSPRAIVERHLISVEFSLPLD